MDQPSCQTMSPSPGTYRSHSRFDHTPGSSQQLGGGRDPPPWCGLLTFWVEPSKRRALIPCRPATTVRSSRVAFHLIKPHQPGSWAWTFGIDARRRVLQARLWTPNVHVPWLAPIHTFLLGRRTGDSLDNTQLVVSLDHGGWCRGRGSDRSSAIGRLGKFP